MKKSCSYCGGIHDRTYVCPAKPKRSRVKNRTEGDKLRNTKAWRDKSKFIRQRDKYLCVFCIRNLYHTTQRYTFDVSVHHIKPLSEGGSLLKNTNLITVCRMHHDMCECGEIPREIQHMIAKEQEQTSML